jgi:hypothetical protein
LRLENVFGSKDWQNSVVVLNQNSTTSKYLMVFIGCLSKR